MRGAKWRGTRVTADLLRLYPPLLLKEDGFLVCASSFLYTAAG